MFSQRLRSLANRPVYAVEILPAPGEEPFELRLIQRERVGDFRVSLKQRHGHSFQVAQSLDRVLVLDRSFNALANAEPNRLGDQSAEIVVAEDVGRVVELILQRLVLLVESVRHPAAGEAASKARERTHSGPDRTTHDAAESTAGRTETHRLRRSTSRDQCGTAEEHLGQTCVLGHRVFIVVRIANQAVSLKCASNSRGAASTSCCLGVQQRGHSGAGKPSAIEDPERTQHGDKLVRLPALSGNVKHAR